MEIFYPSYGRYKKVHAFEFFKKGFIVVPKSQEHLYRENYGNNIIAIPDEKDGSIAKKRNAIIDLAKDKGIDRFYMIDDDINGCKNIWEEKQFDGEQALEILEEQYNLAKEMNLFMWGFQPSAQNFPSQFKPFSMNKILDQIYGLDISDGLRFDEGVNFYDNMDMCIQKINMHRKIWRVNSIHFEEAYTKGGGDSQIKYDDNDRMYWSKIVQRKWGGDIIRIKDKYVRVKIPIKGV